MKTVIMVIEALFKLEDESADPYRQQMVWTVGY